MYPWAELIYVAAQHSKPSVRTHTVLLGAVWLEIRERNHATRTLHHLVLITYKQSPKTHTHTHTSIYEHTNAKMQMCNLKHEVPFLIYLCVVKLGISSCSIGEIEQQCNVEEKPKENKTNTFLYIIYDQSLYDTINSILFFLQSFAFVGSTCSNPFWTLSDTLFFLLCFLCLHSNGSFQNNSLKTKGGIEVDAISTHSDSESWIVL